jgi:hypothetical protein
MKKLLFVLAGVAAFSLALVAQIGGMVNPFAGRWDLTVTTTNGDSYPDWIEVSIKDGQPQAHIQPRGGGAGYATGVEIHGSTLTLTFQRVQWELNAVAHALTGSIKRNGAVIAQIAGVPAPALLRPMPTAWTAPESIFDGKDLAGWEPIGPGVNNWVAQDGVLLNKAHGQNLKTTRKFDDFKLHIEFNCPDEGNSGIYLRGRYEVQVEYEKPGVNDAFHGMGSIYSFIAPSVELPRQPGQWETFDVTLVGRKVTIVRNGVKTVDNQEIPSPTGGALDSHEAEPGPFYLQGDHTGGMMYRNITVALPKR